MAQIDIYLKQIMDAVYGEEVRESIHHAISAMNVESSQAILDSTNAKVSATNMAQKASDSAQDASVSESNALLSQKAAEISSNSAKNHRDSAEKSKEAALQSAIDANGFSISSANSAASSLHSEKAAEAAAKRAEVGDLNQLETSLSKNHSVLQIVRDHVGDALLDSDNRNMEGQVIFADVVKVIALEAIVSAMAKQENTDSITMAKLNHDVNNNSKRLDSMENSLIKEHSLYSVVGGSDGMPLIDSFNHNIESRVIYADKQDILLLQKTVTSLETIIKTITSNCVPLRLEAAEQNINSLLVHALLDNTAY